MHRINLALVALTLTLLIATPASAFAVPGASQDQGAPGGPPLMFASVTEPDGTVADELAFAFVSTLAGFVLVSLVFRARRKQS